MGILHVTADPQKIKYMRMNNKEVKVIYNEALNSEQRDKDIVIHLDWQNGYYTK